MDAFGDVLGRVVAEAIILIEGTLGHYVNFGYVDGNMTNISLSVSGQSFCQNWSDLFVSFAGVMNSMMNALWSVHVS